MTAQKAKLTLIRLIMIGFPLWWGASALGDSLGDFFYWFEMENNPRLLAAQASQVAFQNRIMQMPPAKIKNTGILEISARSAVSVLLDNFSNETILFEKNKSEVLPIASLSKLMTAKVVLDNYDLKKEITVSQEAIDQEENFGKLSAGDKLSVEYILYPLLIESSNDAAYALVNDYDGVTESEFVGLMNAAANKIGMAKSHFFNSSGLEPDVENPKINLSTAQDLTKLAKSLLGEPLIWKILSTRKFDAYGPELINTNELLGKLPGIVGGKTGYAEKAGGCLLLVTKAPNGKGYIISVILGSNSRFREMEQLVNWVNSAYAW